VAEEIGLRFEVDSDSGESEIAALTKELREFTRALKGAEEGAESAERDLDKVGDGSDKAGKGLSSAKGSASGFSGVMKGAFHPAVLAGTAAVAGLALGLKALGGFLIDSIEAGAEQAEVNGRQAAALRSLGVASKQAAQLTRQYNSTVADLSKQTGVGDEALTNALSSMNAMAQEAKTAEEANRDLGFALAASAQSGKDVGETAKTIQKAYNGEIETAKELLGLTKEQQQALTAMTDAGERQAKIQELMTAKFGDQLTALDPLQVSTKNLSNAYGDFQQTIGLAIRESGAFEPVLDVLTKALRDVEGWVEANSDTIREWVFMGVDKAISAAFGLMDVLQGLSPVFTGMITYVRVASEWYQALWGGVKVVGKGLLALGSKVISMVTKRWSEFFDGAAKVAEFMGLDFAESLRSASDGLSSFSDSADDLATHAFKDVEKDAAGVRDNIEGMADSLLDAPETMDRINAGIEELRGRIRTMRTELQKAREAGPSADDAEGGGTGPAPSVTDERDLAAQEEKLRKLEQEREQLRLRNEAAARKLDIVRQEDTLKRLQLELNLAIWEIEKADLTTAEAKLQTVQAIQTYEQGVADLKKEQADAERNAQAQARKLRQQELKHLEALKKKREAAIKGDIENAKLLGGALSRAFEMAGASARVLSVIRAAQYAAEAIGLGAIGDFRGAIQAGLAAGEHAAIAAGAGGGGGSGGGGGGAGTSTGALNNAGPRVTQRDFEASQERLAELFAEKLRNSGGPSTINIPIDFGSSVQLQDANEVKRQIADGLKDTLRQEGIDLRRLL
jgi:hypothetical protein